MYTFLLTKRNGKGVWMREIEKALKRFGASLEWLLERIGMRDDEIEKIEHDEEIEGSEKTVIIKAKRMKSISDVLEEVEVLIGTHFFDEFSETKSSVFLKKVIANQSVIEKSLLKKTWRTLNCTPKTMKIIREIQENLLVLGKGRSLSPRRGAKRNVGAARPGFH